MAHKKLNPSNTLGDLGRFTSVMPDATVTKTHSRPKGVPSTVTASRATVGDNSRMHVITPKEETEAPSRDLLPKPSLIGRPIKVTLKKGRQV